jgi:hypothetical protein
LNTTLNADGSACHSHPDDVSRDTGVAQAQIRSYRLADGFQRQAAKSNCWPLFLRYQAQTERLYRRAVEEFERLRAQWAPAGGSAHGESEAPEARVCWK